MKTMINNVKFVALFLGLFVMISCGEEETIDPPLAYFTAEADAENSQLFQFTNGSQGTGTYLWDFGDDETSTEENPSHEYANGGTYNVSLTVTNEGGTDTYSEEITVAPSNLITNGSFDDASGWTIINLYECTNERGAVTIADGIATFSETEQAADGGWKHMGIYQELTLEAGTYSVDLMVEYTDIADVWGELYVGATMPVACTNESGTDYTDNMVLTALNAWDCNKTYSGSAVENACKVPEGGTNGEFTLDAAGTYYLVFKTGGGAYGERGIKIDDITLYKR